MAEWGVAVDHTNVYRWVQKFTPLLAMRFRRGKKHPVGSSWRMDETYIRIKGQWKYWYRAVDKAGQTVDFLLTAHRDKKAALRFLKKAISQHGRPVKVTIDQSEANARTTLQGFELMYRIKKGQIRDPQSLSAAEQFYSLAA